MPTKNPRIHVVLETPLYKNLKGLAERRGCSMSLEARELIRDALCSAGRRTLRIYTGKQMKNLIGSFRFGKLDLDKELGRQVHG
ncbi:MAG: hypothetical protein HYT97_06665 [Elusimicrobia bacterium]|nr:hypothetical protein [Elusimicrobiota bacterium]